MIVAITGGSGFIGKTLAFRLMESGDEVRVLTRNQQNHDVVKYGNAGGSIRTYRGDITEKSDSLTKFADNADVLYHCAAETADIEKMRAVHVQGTKNLLDAAKGRIGKWVQLSSVGVYGAKRDGVVSELEQINPSNTYEQTKAESDMEVLAEAEASNITCSILRPSIVFGAEMTNLSLFSLLAMIEKGLFFFIGKPGASANYIHVDNVVDAMILIADSENSNSQTYNLSDWRTIEEFISTICKKMHRKSNFVRLPEWIARLATIGAGLIPGMPLTRSRVDALTTRCVYDSEKIKNELGYGHRVSMEDGLGSLVDRWMQDYK